MLNVLCGSQTSGHIQPSLPHNKLEQKQRSSLWSYTALSSTQQTRTQTARLSEPRISGHSPLPQHNKLEHKQYNLLTLPHFVQVIENLRGNEMKHLTHGAYLKSINISTFFGSVTISTTVSEAPLPSLQQPSPPTHTHTHAHTHHHHHRHHHHHH
jgi:hypothetical protein